VDLAISAPFGGAFFPEARPVAGMLRRVPAVQREAADLEVERGWVDRAKAGDHAALRSILEKYGPVLYRAVLLPRLGDEARAKDALSDTYTKVVVTIARYEWHPAGIWPWLRTIAFHVAIDQLRARKRETPFEVDDLEREVDQKSDAPSGTDVAYLEQEERVRAKKKVEDALEKINPRYAQAIRLRVLEERGREEVAQMLGVTAATFDVVLHRAMAAMRKVLTAEGVPDSDRALDQARVANQKGARR
jgi:RNA polymerase sigma-70 factor (ECF subfamily)